ncbi:MAG: hypothetical protein CM15mP70_00620 [Pelagibacteraceae bacterium]|nr:MAG: hypothetical protein CM15mP70_00620 [Pelagibacteraceae bacterium]
MLSSVCKMYKDRTRHSCAGCGYWTRWLRAKIITNLEGLDFSQEMLIYCTLQFSKNISGRFKSITYQF